MAAGCIIVPIPSIDPDYQTDIIDEVTLESLTGVHEEEVIGRIGPPDYSGPRGHSYMLVYQGEKHFSTDVVWIVGGMGGGGGGVINTGKTKVLYCFVIELDEDHIVHGNEVIDSALVGTRRDSSDDPVAPIADCSEAVWKPDDRKEVLTKTAYLEVQAEAGSRAAAFALATEFDDITYLKALAKDGDREATFLLAREFHVETGLKVLARQGDIEAAKELVKLTGESTEALRELAESGDLAAATLLARYANELGPLRSLAESGNYEAAHALVWEFEDDAYVDTLAEKGNYVAAYERYQRLRSGSETNLTAWRWLCLAANAGYSKAQAEVGHWHTSTSWENWRGWHERGLNLLRKAGVQPDSQIAYMWYTLAVSNGDESTLSARDYYVAELLTDNEIAQAERMARDWKPGDCPSAEHRLGPPGGILINELTDR
jgi:TPR repeat protein